MLRSGHSLSGLQEEIDKCIVVCENCHRIIHSKG
jgi:predicted HNH restriction endonuclease